MKNLLFKIPYIESTWQNIAVLFLRFAIGLSMAFGHGMGKIPPSEGFIKGVGGMGFPAPAVFAWAAGISEFFGGLLIAIGLLTRPSAFFGAVTMFVAFFIRHADDPFGRKEKALLYLVIFVFLMVTGPGKYSLDERINKKLFL